MSRIWLPLLVAVLLAACGTAPQQAARSKPAASTSANRTYKPPPGFPTFVDHSVGREEISIQAMSLVGVPYRWGGNTPDAGFDCSGLVRYVVDRAASVNLPRTTAEMSSRGDSVEPDEIAPGDLIFFNTTGRPHSHVGIYVGKLRFVNAPSTGGTVRLDYLTNPYWAKRFDGIRRVAPPKSAPAPFDAPTYLASPASAPAATPPVATPAPPPTPAPTYARQAPPPASADAFEPPPSTLTAAQRQSQAAGATTPSVAAVGATPDPIQAAADAFEPPPPTSRAARQQARTAQAAADDPAEPPVRVMRASTGSLAAPRPVQNDDPIARFATGTN
ncbi:MULTISPECIES: C40 family peptidase [Caballeronia]|uniref:C40 family peptidase n=1 Tax=Caballeronia TaxID=1827195 RepID=UPI00045EF672|nr:MULTISPECIES: C40 family peptidase [unclassified Caballeronia]MCE4541944.1 NlpC/P60 family protein [Caballeronia sp. PC1]MCE4569010.1 NlpC/P60 family protein [Caballeronia sp. CLC5]BAO86270.1 NLP/P60 protein [Burkholderia sp. RPE67]